MDIEQKINIDLGNVNKWLISNKLTLNTKKMEYTIIVSQNSLNNILSNLKVLIRDQKITKVAHKEFRGVIVGENLNWHKHIDTQCKKFQKF